MFNDTTPAAGPGPSRAPEVPVPPHAWHRAFRDLPREHGFERLTVEGHLPEGLRGTLYRNGPSLFSTFGRRYGHWFDGDGAVSAVRFDGEGALGAVRLVQSRALVDERRRGRAYYANYGTPAPTWWRSLVSGLTLDFKNAANTSVMIWQGRLYALFEVEPPTELSIEDLSTLGERDLDGAVLVSFSAHPHYVPARRSAYNFGVRYGRRTELDLFALPNDGPARRLGTLELPGPTMIHDFMATERNLVFFAPPLRLRLFKQLAGLGSFSENLRWLPGEGTEVLVVPIDAPVQARRFTVPAFYQWHFADARERGRELLVDYVRFPDFATNRWLRQVLDGPTDRAVTGQLYRAILDPARGTMRSEPLAAIGCDFPRVPRPNHANPFVYVAAHSDDEAARGMWDRVARAEVETGRVESVSFGPGRYPSEPVFVRRPDPGGDQTGDNGWLLTLVYDAVADRSGLAVLDAGDLGRGTLACAWFDHHVPFTFHGNFYPHS